MDNVIVIDEVREKFQNNNLFNKDLVSLSAGDQFWPYFQELCQTNNITCLTIDCYLKNAKNFKNAFFISHQPSISKTKFSIDKNFVNTILYSAESPQNSKTFHNNIFEITKYFKNAILFNGIHDFVHPNCKTHNFYWPIDNNFQTENISNDWNRKKLLAFIASPKSNISINYNNILSRIISKPRHYFNKFKYFNNPILNFNDLYEKRFQIISELSSNTDFYLFGRNWETAIKYNKLLKNTNFANKPSESLSKASTISEFKYVLCIENTILNGYVTEKIFDAMLYGAVPVYYGAPDVNEIIPENCYIDLSKINYGNSLVNYLKEISFDKWEDYRLNINSFLNSNQILKHNCSNIAELFFNITFSEMNSINK